MRRHFILMTSLFASAALSLPAYAADAGTYRPGSPYHSITAAAAEACAAQCSGDAQCKGWNFVKANPRQAKGVCEFNSQAASPIPSPVSVSGEGAGILRDARLTSGGTNTVRVGSPVRPKAATPAKTRTRPAPKAQAQRTSPSSSPARRVVREAVPQRAQPRSTVARNPHQTLMQQQQMQRAMSGIPQVPQTRQMQRPAPPRFQHNLDGGRMNPAMMPQGMPQRMPQGLPQQNMAPAGGDASQEMQRRLLEYQMRERMKQQAAHPGAAPGMQVPQRAPMTDPRMQRQAPQGPRTQGPLTQAPATPQQPVMPRRPAANAGSPFAPGPNYRGQTAAPQQQAQMQAPAQPPVQARRPMTAAQAEQSLFGSLYDDVVAPKPMTEAEAKNPEAPIATVTAVPVKKVTEETLFGLAGGRR